MKNLIKTQHWETEQLPFLPFYEEASVGGDT